MVRRTKEDALVTRQRILDAAARIFDQRGIDGTTLGAVAEAAQITRGAIYWHFTDKHGLYAAVCAQAPLPLELLPAAIGDASAADPVGRLRAVCLDALSRAATDPDAMRTLSEPADRQELLDPAGMLLLRRRMTRADSRTCVEQALRSLVEAGGLPADLDTSLATTTLHTMLAGLLSEWLLAQEKFDLQARAQRLFDALLFMLRGAPSLRKGTVPKDANAAGPSPAL